MAVSSTTPAYRIEEVRPHSRTYADAARTDWGTFEGLTIAAEWSGVGDPRPTAKLKEGHLVAVTPLQRRNPADAVIPSSESKN